METLRINFVSDRCYPIYEGGYERHTFELATRLARNHSVTIRTSLAESERIINDVRYARISPFLRYTRRSGSHSFSQSCAFGLAVAVFLPKLSAVDFVDVQGIPFMHMPAIQARRLLGDWALGLTVPETFSGFPGGSNFASRFARVVLASAVHFATLGDFRILTGARVVRTALVKRLGVDPRRVSIVSPGIDLSRLDGKESIAAGHDVVCLSRLDPYKRVADVVRAVAIVSAQGHPITLGIIGEGPETGNIRRLISDLGLERMITLYGRIPDETKYAILKASSLYVLASEREGFSISTLEAMASGCCPIVARPKVEDAFGVSELVENRRTGLAYPVGGIEELAGQIKELLTDRGLRTRLSSNARAKATEYDYSLVVDRYLKSVKQFLDERAACS